MDLGRVWGSAFLPNYLESLTVVSGLDLKHQGPKPGTALPEKCLGYNEWKPILAPYPVPLWIQHLEDNTTWFFRVDGIPFSLHI